MIPLGGCSQAASGLGFYYVEFLNLKELCRWVWVRYLPMRAGTRHGGMFVFDATRPAAVAVKILQAVLHVPIEILQFKASQVRDDQGVSTSLDIIYNDLNTIWDLIDRDPQYKAALDSTKARGRLRAYMLKEAVIPHDLLGTAKYSQMHHALTIIRCCAWHCRTIGSQDQPVYLGLQPRAFGRVLACFAERFSMSVRFCHPSCSYLDILKGIYLKLKKLNTANFQRIISFYWTKKVLRRCCRKPAVVSTVSGGVVLADYWGQLNLERPECISDVFFLNADALKGEDVLLLFQNSADPVDEDKLAEMRKAGVRAVAFTPQASLVREEEVPIFVASETMVPDPVLPAPWTAYEQKYEKLKAAWFSFFKEYQVKVWTTWYKYDGNQIVIADALKAAGGIATTHQRSFEQNPSVRLSSCADIIFGFAPEGYAREKASRSVFSYHVSTGYLWDGHYPRLKAMARDIREEMQANGARHIVAYLDENTMDDPRWFLGHEEARRNYGFWLEKVLSDPQLGIVFKPKKPATLRRRLGAVADMLARAEKTGRCRVIEGGMLHGSYPPAFAALAADLAVHDTLCAGSAGMDAALAGVPTLLMDLDGWPSSPLHRLGSDVVFTDWPTAWKACEEFFKDPKACPRFGNWSGMVHELDPFHDGKAAERMSRYLKDLLEGLRSGERPESVMELVAEKYMRTWGKDKIGRG
ncbi:MAG: hypothetical protein HQL19_04830 [Candidatus Omnitrophica bacterium]|nr:hypothetical protein [Candidatus Omnitrophota bacterium]